MYDDFRDWLAFADHDRAGSESQTGSSLKVEIPLDIMQRLLEDGHLCAADVRCLDNETKKALQRLCLANCARCLSESGCSGLSGTEKCSNPECCLSEGSC